MQKQGRVSVCDWGFGRKWRRSNVNLERCDRGRTIPAHLFSRVLSHKPSLGFVHLEYMPGRKKKKKVYERLFCIAIILLLVQEILAIIIKTKMK